MLRGNLEDRNMRLRKVVDEIQAAKHEEKLAERTARGRELEDKKDTLNKELKTLSLQADSRAKLDLKKHDIRSKHVEVKSM
jgi:DNA repair protein RAD50